MRVFRPSGERKGCDTLIPKGELACKRLKSGRATLYYEYLILDAMEHFFVCPHCGERISMVLDTSVKGQTYVEDCEVCCQPVKVRYTAKDDEVRHFEASAM
jgi:hypothetical protein